MSVPFFELNVVVYGSAEDDPTDNSRFRGYDSRRAEVHLQPPLPKDTIGDRQRLKDWSCTVIDGLYQDVKHSQKWFCAFCGESIFNSIQYTWYRRMISCMKLDRQTRQGRIRDCRGVATVESSESSRLCKPQLLGS